MSVKRVCPRCEQDWVHQYRFKADGSCFWLCTECDSLWWPDDTVEIARAHFLDDVVATRLGVEDNPWTDRVWADVIEPVAEGRTTGAPDGAGNSGESR
ncbi:hypothetical protein ACFRIC_37705 [Streptomyces sp. NPDC056738]|uniref:hypothetical protein n=1 Tax=Streptomyces sp. NPDC056738 TaxID=3345933 RepID=UPI0036BFDA29